MPLATFSATTTALVFVALISLTLNFDGRCYSIFNRDFCGFLLALFMIIVVELLWASLWITSFSTSLLSTSVGTLIGSFYLIVVLRLGADIFAIFWGTIVMNSLFCGSLIGHNSVGSVFNLFSCFVLFLFWAFKGWNTLELNACIPFCSFLVNLIVSLFNMLIKVLRFLMFMFGFLVIFWIVLGL